MSELKGIIISGKYSRDMEGLIASITANGIRIVNKPPEPVKPLFQLTEGKQSPGHCVGTKVGIGTPLSLSPEDAAYYTRLLSQSCRYPALGVQEEAHLGRRIAAGDTTARDRLIESNQRLVVRTAREYAGQGLDFADLVSAGDLGLLRAVEKFSRRRDCQRGCHLSTYAARLIRESIVSTLTTVSRFLSAPDDLIDYLDKVDRAAERLHRQRGLLPTDEELAASLGMTVGQIARCRHIEQCLRQTPLSITHSERIDQTGTGTPLIESKSPTPEEETFNKYYKEQLVRILETLPEREKRILIYREGLQGEYDHTLEEVGTMFRVTRERVRQIEAKAKRKLKAMIAKENGVIDEYVHNDGNVIRCPIQPRAHDGRLYCRAPDERIGHEWLEILSPSLRQALDPSSFSLSHTVDPSDAAGSGLTPRTEYHDAMQLCGEGDRSYLDGHTEEVIENYGAAVMAAPFLRQTWGRLGWIRTLPRLPRDQCDTLDEYGFTALHSLYRSLGRSYAGHDPATAVAQGKAMLSIFPRWQAAREILVCALGDSNMWESAVQEYALLQSTEQDSLYDSPWMLLAAAIMGDSERVEKRFQSALHGDRDSMPDHVDSAKAGRVLEEHANAALSRDHLWEGLTYLEAAIATRKKPTRAEWLGAYGLCCRLHRMPEADALRHELSVLDIRIPSHPSTISAIRLRLSIRG